MTSIALTGISPDISHLLELGCTQFVNISSQLREGNIATRAPNGILTGSLREAYRLYIPECGQICSETPMAKRPKENRSLNEPSGQKESAQGSLWVLLLDRSQ